MKKYLEIYEKIKKDMQCGALKKGDRLPSKRVTAEKTGASVITVEHAYEMLCSEGYATAKERSGYFVSYNEGDFFRERPAMPQKTTPAPKNAARENEGVSFDRLAKTTRTVLSEYGEKLLEKTENKGAIELRLAIRDYLQRNKNVFVDAERIVVGSGAEYLYGLIIELLGEGAVYALETPSYPQIARVYTAKNAKTVAAVIGENGIPSDTLAALKANALHVTPFGHYPTGVCADASKKAEYLRWAQENSAYIIEDDYESEFSLLGSVAETLFSADKNDCVIYVNTFSKTIAHSIRVGYMILPERLVRVFDHKLGFYSCTVPTLEQYIIATLLSDGSFEKHLNKIRRLRRQSSL